MIEIDKEVGQEVYIRMDNWCPTENDVIFAVVNKLKDLDFKIEKTCNTEEHGIDIVASKGHVKIMIEAKGATSSKKGSRRCGKPFDRNQARSHISVALFTVMSYLTEYQHSDEYELMVGIALPEERNHKELINRVKYAIDKLGILIFWAGKDEVTVDIPPNHGFPKSI